MRAAAHAKYGGEQGIEDRRTKQLATQAERCAKKRTKEINEASWPCCKPVSVCGVRLAEVLTVAQSGREAQKLQRIRERIDSEVQSPDRPGAVYGCLLVSHLLAGSE